MFFLQTLDREFVGDYGTGFTDFGTGETIQQTLAHNTDFG